MNPGRKKDWRRKEGWEFKNSLDLNEKKDVLISSKKSQRHTEKEESTPQR